MDPAPSHRNALAEETSPYLLQHAGNPVDWYPWCADALEKAKRENKPILLSVGYSACHWCHVMAHESFEDESTASLMNELFVNIKVDREERPDLDKIYQTAQHLLTQRTGGWPLTMFLTADDQTPFFGGTYFPDAPRFGMPSFKEVLARVSQYHERNRDDIRRQNRSLVEALQGMEPEPGHGEIVGPKPIEESRSALQRSFDPNHGGFGAAPKFPHPTNLQRLLRTYAASAAEGRPDQGALRFAEFTLRKMALGGIYDQLGGGFCRYSVDEQWMIPHFEKMLYDNGPLLALCAETWQITGDALFRRVAAETAHWAMREMQSPEGGYYSSLDADSEGEEGKFYVWTPQEVRERLSEDEFAPFAARFGLDRAANFEGQYWHLHAFTDFETLARRFHSSEADIEASIERSKRKLLEVRSARVWPGRDEKVLTSWNALMIKGMAVAGRILADERLTDSAERALAFIRERMWDAGRLHATYKDGRARFSAYLDDYAFTIDAVLSLLENRWDRGDIEFAVELAEVLVEQFEDADNGGFFFTANDHETLIQRPKPFADDALPAGNGIAAHVLGRLGHVLGETRYLEAAERTIRAGWKSIAQVPHAHTTMLLAVEEYIYPPQTIVLRGEGDELAEWARRCRRCYAPRRLVLAIPAGAGGLPGMLAERRAQDHPVAFVCEGHHCEAPLDSLDALDETLRRGEVPAPN